MKKPLFKCIVKWTDNADDFPIVFQLNIAVCLEKRNSTLEDNADAIISQLLKKNATT